MEKCNTFNPLHLEEASIPPIQLSFSRDAHQTKQERVSLGRKEDPVEPSEGRVPRHQPSLPARQGPTLQGYPRPRRPPHVVSAYLVFFFPPVLDACFNAARDLFFCSPWHGACFKVQSGDIEDAPSLDSLAKYTVKIVGDAVVVSADEDGTVSIFFFCFCGL